MSDQADGEAEEEGFVDAVVLFQRMRKRRQPRRADSHMINSSCWSH
ncbi:hypothetical protein [Streptomyces sp. NPDC002952]